MNETNTSVHASDSDVEGLELCISCLKENVPGTHFCPHCGTPLTSYAATVPMANAFAEGDFLRKAVSQTNAGPFVRTVLFLTLVFMVFGLLLAMTSR